MSDILSRIKSDRLYFDGACGSYLASLGLLDNIPPEELNRINPGAIIDFHREYLMAGADIIKTNTFGINPLKYEDYSARIKEGVRLARASTEGFSNKYVALDIGPLGKLLQPIGDLPFERAVSLFSSVAEAGADECDLVLIETMGDCAEVKSAVLGVKAVTDKPIFVSCVFDERGRLMTGATPEAMIAMLEGLGVTAVGMNCSFGPDKMLPIAKIFKNRASIPVIINPNAGLPRVVGGEAVYDLSPDAFARIMRELAEFSCILGGCCGTTPEHIRELVNATRGMPFFYPTKKNLTVVSSYTHACDITDDITLVGERINPTGKPKLKSALREGNIDYIVAEAINQKDRGVHILDVNVGLPEIDEVEMMRICVSEIQSVVDLPLQLDTASVEALESGMRVYIGKPLINSVNGKAESMAKIFPLVKKYGGVLIALTLDENGIPQSAVGRVEIAKRIITEAEKYGIDKCDIIVDPLVMSVSSDKNSARVTLDSVRMLTELGIKVSLGVSNISFGLPDRDRVSGAFFLEAMREGLNMAIMNPHSDAMMSAYYTHRALMGFDEGCRAYIEKFSKESAPLVAKDEELTLKNAILRGMCERASAIARELGKEMSVRDIIDNEIIPALDEIGARFESGRAFLPELLSVAETASAAFNEIRALMPRESEDNGKKIILATVKGDIHDIGKNIVKVMLESYGFTCIDLGKDVTKEKILEAVVKNNVTLVGLSALMTTTVGAMEDTISLIKREAPSASVMVGGAVLTEEYAYTIGADYYGEDAMQSVRIAEAHFNKK